MNKKLFVNDDIPELLSLWKIQPRIIYDLCWPELKLDFIHVPMDYDLFVENLLR
ncbi:hypothetical protein D3C81_2259960 [compost metagenome]